MSNDAHQKARSVFGYAALALVVLALGVGVGGLGGYSTVLVLATVFVSAVAWWWFDHCIEVDKIADGYREPRPTKDRDN